jgi:hypothetical protein
MIHPLANANNVIEAPTVLLLTVVNPTRVATLIDTEPAPAITFIILTCPVVPVARDKESLPEDKVKLVIDVDTLAAALPVAP